MSMKIVYSMAVIICAAMWFGSCQNEELDYYPLEKKHLGETYTEYVMNNIISNDTVSRIALNFYPEEVTSLSYVDYDESTCIFTFHRGNTSRYRLSWDYETDGSYVEDHDQLVVAFPLFGAYLGAHQDLLDTVQVPCTTGSPWKSARWRVCG